MPRRHKPWPSRSHHRRGIALHTHWIYALVDARDDSVGYVGVTHDVEKRLRQHLAARGGSRVARWVRSVTEAGGTFGTVTLARVEVGENIFAREAEHIRAQFNTGARLMNFSLAVRLAERDATETDSAAQ